MFRALRRRRGSSVDMMRTNAPDDRLTLQYDQDVAVLTLAQPGRHNAISAAMWAGLSDALSDVAQRPEARVLIVRGADGHFAAGADITEFESVFADHASALRYAATMGTALDMLARLPIPTLAVIEGFCIGAGVALALACDLRIASVDARFAVTPAKLGLMYTLADTHRLVGAVGASLAKDLLFTGRRIGAPDALAMRLVDELHDPATLMSASLIKARQIAAASPWSVRHAKAVVGLIGQGTTDDTEATRAWFADATQGADFKEGLAAFRAGRPPRFAAE